MQYIVTGLVYQEPYSRNVLANFSLKVAIDLYKVKLKTWLRPFVKIFPDVSAYVSILSGIWKYLKVKVLKYKYIF